MGALSKAQTSSAVTIRVTIDTSFRLPEGGTFDLRRQAKKSKVGIHRSGFTLALSGFLFCHLKYIKVFNKVILIYLAFVFTNLQQFV
jgi:hypothetical protein